MKKFILLTSIALGAVVGTQAQSKKETSNNTYGNNVVRFSPINIYDAGIGLGLSYERLLDKEQKIGFELPLDLIMVPEGMNGSGNGGSYYYFSPGFKFYPAGQRRITYALGANLIMGFGTRTQTITQFSQNGTPFSFTEESNNTRLGVIINNHLNFNVGRHFVIGLNGGLGVLYLNKYSSNLNMINREGMMLTGQFKFSLGVRF